MTAGLVLYSLGAVELTAERKRQILEEEIVWELVEDEAGIKVYLGDWPGSDFVAFRSETEFNFSIRKLLRLIEDVEAYKEWMPDCRESELLATEKEGVILYYISMNSPWPLSDRDWVNRLVIEDKSQNGKITVIYKAAPGVLPEKPGLIRIHKHYALWKLTPLGKNRVHSIWYGHSEPEGRIPGWLAKYTIDRMILETTNNMKNNLKNMKE